jgi:hypothetical protein
MGYIAELLRHPHAAIEAARLAGVDIESTSVAPARGIEMTDEQTLKAVRTELANTKAALRTATWPERGELEEKASQLEEYLAEVENHQGQARKVAGTAQRARSAVTNAISRAIEKISEQHADLGLHLQSSIETGTMPIYAPADAPDWSF